MRSLVVGALLLPSVAFAELPQVDGSDDCRMMADYYTDPSILADCAVVEEQSRDALLPAWDGLPAEVRTRCATIVGSGLPVVSMYQTLALCVAQEMDERALPLPFELPAHVDELRN